MDSLATPVPDAIEPILAMRTWRIKRGRLISWARPYWWHPGENIADCVLQYWHDKNWSGFGSFFPWASTWDFTECSCGFYAVDRQLRIPFNPGGVYGVVALYGRVIVGSRGYRATKAKIVFLVSKNPITRFRLRRVTEYYNVPVLWRWPASTRRGRRGRSSVGEDSAVLYG